jgi:hypothetical protein
VLGAAGGAIGGGIGGSLGGKLAESALGDVLPKLVTNTLEAAAIGGISGDATGAAQYGLRPPGRPRPGRSRRAAEWTTARTGKSAEHSARSTCRPVVPAAAVIAIKRLAFLLSSWKWA